MSYKLPLFDNKTVCGRKTFINTCVFNSFLHLIQCAYNNSKTFKNLVDRSVYPKVLIWPSYNDRKYEKRKELLMNLYKSRMLLKTDQTETIDCTDNAINLLEKLFDAVPSLVEDVVDRNGKVIDMRVAALYFSIDNIEEFYDLELTIEKKYLKTEQTVNNNQYKTKQILQEVLWVVTCEVKFDGYGFQIPHKINIKNESFELQGFANFEQEKPVEKINHMVAYCKLKHLNQDKHFDFTWTVFDDGMKTTGLGRDKKLFHPVVLLFTKES